MRTKQVDHISADDAKAPANIYDLQGRKASMQRQHNSIIIVDNKKMVK